MVDGEEEAFRALIVRHGPAIARVCRHYEAAPDVRRDLEQDVLLALWRAQQTFRGECSERTWVYRVAHNVGATHVMRALRRPRASVARGDGGPVEPAEEAPRPDVTAEQRDRLSRVQSRIRRLDLISQQLVLLALEGCTSTEIAEVTGLSASNVTTRLSRLRRALLEGDSAEEAG